MNLIIKIVFLTIILSNISACSWLFGDDGMFRDRGNDYRKATVTEQLVVPEGMSSQVIDESYAIPAISDRTSLDEIFEVPMPDPISQDVNRDTVRINTLADKRWILLDGSPGQVWPRLRGFFNLNNLPVQRADATSGILETAWLTPAGENILRERYRLLIEQGVQRGTSEVYVLQADIRAGQDQWPTTSSNIERETLLTQALAQYLADSSAAASVSMLAEQALDASGKITLEENDNGQAYIDLKLPFTRAWASLGNSLEKAGFETTDLNRSERRYYVTYTDKADDETEDGFFSWFSNLFSDNDEASKTQNYYINLKEQDSESVTIFIESAEGDQLNKADAERLLKLIKRYIA